MPTLLHIVYWPGWASRGRYHGHQGGAHEGCMGPTGHCHSMQKNLLQRRLRGGWDGRQCLVTCCGCHCLFRATVLLLHCIHCCVIVGSSPVSMQVCIFNTHLRLQNLFSGVSLAHLSHARGNVVSVGGAE
jgi:hypothetical protein